MPHALFFHYNCNDPTIMRYLAPGSYRLLSDHRCDIDINECVTFSPCQHDGVCLNLPGLFKCECPDQFTGNFCESFRFITCENKPCKNGGTCMDVENTKTGNNYTCTCVSGYEGSDCDTPFCVGRKCQNGGRCNFLYQVMTHCTHTEKPRREDSSIAKISESD